MSVIKKAKLANMAALKMASLSDNMKNKALRKIAECIQIHSKQVIEANRKDLNKIASAKHSTSLFKRAILDMSKIKDMVNEIKAVVKLEDPVNKTLSQVELDKGLMLYKITCPIGVIGMIFESRPDVVTQVVALCIKSGNAVLLKGGSETKNSNRVLVNLIHKALEDVGFPQDAVQLLETRDDVAKMLKLNQFINLLIPRGGSDLVKFVQENTSIPVLGHSEGICHLYIDKEADIKKAIDISFDAKCQYPAVCNAIETLLVHKDIANKFLPGVANIFKHANVELRGDIFSKKILPKIKSATEKDWRTEYNDFILSIKIVSGIDQAIEHINKYGSKHTDAIVTESKKNAEKFMDNVDSASVMWNASTRFADGFRYGKGAEIGISTSKIHSRGPVGLEGLIIYKYKLIGHGQVVSDYVGPDSKKFTHKVIRRV